MGRTRRRKWVLKRPNNQYFLESKPQIENGVVLTMAEFEAMRLKHYTKLTQERAADSMGISQPTFSRILVSAHEKITQALIEGKIIQVFGGEIKYKPSFIGYGCLNCDYEWEDRSASREKKVKCVKCDSENVYYFEREII